MQPSSEKAETKRCRANLRLGISTTRNFFAQLSADSTPNVNSSKNIENAINSSKRNKESPTSKLVDLCNKECLSLLTLRLVTNCES